MYFVTFTTIKFLLFITAIFNDDVKTTKTRINIFFTKYRKYF